jgi:hypothetical protein
MLGDYVKASEDLKDERLKCIRAMFEKCKMMLIPVYGENPGRWTFLGVEKCEPIKLTYYDSLHNVHQDNLKNCKTLLEVLGLDLEERLGGLSKEFLQ